MIYKSDRLGVAVTLEQLRVFLAVAELQHVTRAAKGLNLAQSAVSHAIAALEARHDAQLFDRIGRRIELTEAGRVLLVQARAILAQVEQAELALSEFGRLERGTLTVHASQTIAGYWLPRHLAAFRRRHPGINIRLAIGNTSQVAEAVAEGSAELGFVEAEVSMEMIESQAVARDQLLLVVSQDHPWPSDAKPNAHMLKAVDWVLREPGSGTPSTFERAMTNLGIGAADLRIAMELPSNEAVRSAVEAGLGATALSASVAASSIEAELLRRVPLALPEREYRVLRHRHRYRSRLSEAMLEIVGGGSPPFPN